MRNKLLEDVARNRQEEQMQNEDLFLRGGSVRCVVCRTNIVGAHRISRTCDKCLRKASETTEPKSS